MFKAIYKNSTIHKSGNSWFTSDNGDSPDCMFLFNQETFEDYLKNGIVKYFDDDMHECKHPALKGSKCDCIGECGFL